VFYGLALIILSGFLFYGITNSFKNFLAILLIPGLGLAIMLALEKLSATSIDPSYVPRSITQSLQQHKLRIGKRVIGKILSSSNSIVYVDINRSVHGQIHIVNPQGLWAYKFPPGELVTAWVSGYDQLEDKVNLSLLMPLRERGDYFFINQKILGQVEEVLSQNIKVDLGNQTIGYINDLQSYSADEISFQFLIPGEYVDVEIASIDRERGAILLNIVDAKKTNWKISLGDSTIGRITRGLTILGSRARFLRGSQRITEEAIIWTRVNLGEPSGEKFSEILEMYAGYLAEDHEVISSHLVDFLVADINQAIDFSLPDATRESAHQEILTLLTMASHLALALSEAISQRSFSANVGMYHSNELYSQKLLSTIASELSELLYIISELFQSIQEKVLG
jgi:exosome complex RNA-binding protein Rrp4